MANAKIEGGLYWGSGIDTDGLRQDDKKVRDIVRDLVRDINKQFASVKPISIQVNKMLLLKPQRRQKISQS